MQTQQHEAVFAAPMSQVFRALLRALAFRRWCAAEVIASEPGPRPGQRYRYQTATALRTGSVIEVIRPVTISLRETLDDPPCRVLLRIKCRIEPVEAGSLLRLGVYYELDKAAQLRPRHWSRRLAQHAARVLSRVGGELDRQQTDSAANS